MYVCVCVELHEYVWLSVRYDLCSNDEVAEIVLQHPGGHWSRKNNKAPRVDIPLAIFESNIIEKEGEVTEINR